MKKKRTRRLLVGAVAPIAATAVFAAAAAAAVGTGPSTSINPYLTPVAPGVDLTSVLSVYDTIENATDGYKMVGLPDGLGARTLPSGDIEVYMNHELGATAGIARAHGQKGAFVSKYTIDPTTLEVKTGADLIQSIQYWNYNTALPNGGSFAASPGGSLPFLAAIGRLCSASLATPAQLFNASTGKGFNGNLFLTGEEVGDEAREFAVDVTTGIAYQLPKTGLFSWENAVAATTGTDTTLVSGQEDKTGGYLWAYQGTKTNVGNPAELAGLNNGRNYAAKVSFTPPAGVPTPILSEATFRSTVGLGIPANVTFTDVNWNQSGALQHSEAAAEGGMTFNRIEDGAWDPNNPNVFYFVTTASFNAPANAGTALWKLEYTNVGAPITLDPSDPNGLLQNGGPTQSGATLTMLLGGTEIPSNDAANGKVQMFDNMDVDTQGHILLQEDPGNQTYLARMYAYRISDGKLVTLARFNTSPYNGATTNDEESSGIVDTASMFGAGTFLFDAQIHSAQGLPAGTGAGTVEEFAENGQLLLMKVNDWQQVFDGASPLVPETPVVVLMSVSALAVLGGGVLFIKRRKGFVIA